MYISDLKLYYSIVYGSIMANGEFEMLPGANVLVFGSTKKRPMNNVTHISLNGETCLTRGGHIT